ncbi:hypothetical protein Tco_0682769 [Tanacetum coccineum]|uniref:Reverse transcriptase domain-containing protein n=1 Tax=Tanacetum coccineum TaxID=301880 RepID=A0ABQ4XSB4_9ASTR
MKFHPPLHVTSTSVKLMLFPFSIEGAARIWLELKSPLDLDLQWISLNSAAGGNFLDKMPRDCLRIIESKSKVRNSRNKPVVAKVSSSSSTPGISPDVAELKDMVKLFFSIETKPKLPLPSKRSRKVVLLVVVLILTEIVPPPMATFIVTRFKNLLLS